MAFNPIALRTAVLSEIGLTAQLNEYILTKKKTMKIAQYLQYDDIMSSDYKCNWVIK